mmetsp:Transcript_133178/g.230468  ORF Transcript_133178/g.230468 Transcript_133178/m.230468 type:complete len:115 (+) Transcript_133178:271-615(+)
MTRTLLKGWRSQIITMAPTPHVSTGTVQILLAGLPVNTRTSSHVRTRVITWLGRTKVCMNSGAKVDRTKVCMKSGSKVINSVVMKVLNGGRSAVPPHLTLKARPVCKLKVGDQA